MRRVKNEDKDTSRGSVKNTKRRFIRLGAVRKNASKVDKKTI